MLNDSDKITEKDIRFANKAEHIITVVLSWTLFLPLKLLIISLKSEKHRYFPAILSILLAHLYVFGIMCLASNYSRAMSFYKTYRDAIIYDCVFPEEKELPAQPMQNIPDVFSFAMNYKTGNIYDASYTQTDIQEKSAAAGSTDAYAESSSIAVDDKTVVYVTKSGTKYHKEGCSSLRNKGTEMPLNEAILAGYEPCKLCFK